MTVQNPRLRSFADNAICFGIGAMLHEIAVVDMEVIDGYTWHGGLTTHESTVFVMRYLGSALMIVSIFTIVYKLYKDYICVHSDVLTDASEERESNETVG